MPALNSSFNDILAQIYKKPKGFSIFANQYFTMPQSNNKKWFSEWFNTPYYHILYQNRGCEEAEYFINNLTQKLNFPSESRLLDMPCGEGRHSIYLNKKGYTVTGLDLSGENIKKALTHANKTLEFYRHDMRMPFRSNYYHAVFNLFTSLGYFESERENKLVFKNMASALKKEGLVVIDFMNAEKVKKELVACEEKTINNILFKITRSIKNNMIVKEISVHKQNEICEFSEKVKAYNQDDLIAHIESVNIQPLSFYGNYHLEPFDVKKSERLILVGKKQ